MTDAPALVWFRNDLRIEDNPALHAARERGAPVIPLYILDDDLDHAPGGAQRWWLHHSLKSLAKDLKDAGTKLILRRGATKETLRALVDETGAASVFWNRRYYAPHRELDADIKEDLQNDGVDVQSFNGLLLREPWEVETNSGGPYKVYTPFWKKVREMGPARSETRPNMRKIEGPSSFPDSDDLDDWDLLPTKPNWAKEIAETWTPGEQGARDRLNAFLKGPLADYDDCRNRPDRDLTSRLSPHLAFGEISPLTIWFAVKEKIDAGETNDTSATTFLSEIVWREFSYNLLYMFDELPEAPMREEFAHYPWRKSKNDLEAWRRGKTGYPIVDAGMRQLWRTGWMHNRVRMIVGSFLIKDLRIHWREGEEWFWDTLVDADIASNSASWQWVAGCGADAAPYFRVFNPVSQGEKFDPDGDYVREYVPELSKLPKKYIHSPWTAPEDVLKSNGVVLGEDYPEPIVDHGEARKAALAGYDEIKGR